MEELNTLVVISQVCPDSNRLTANVRRNHDPIRKLPCNSSNPGILRNRLNLKRVQTHARYFPSFNHVAHDVLVYQSTARRIDEKGCWFEESETFAGKNAVGTWGKHEMEGDNVGGLQEVFERGRKGDGEVGGFDTGFGQVGRPSLDLSTKRVSSGIISTRATLNKVEWQTYFHSKSERDTSNFGSKPPKSDHTERLALDAKTHPALPTRFIFERPIFLRNLSQQGQNNTPRELRSRVAKHVGAADNNSKFRGSCLESAWLDGSVRSKLE